MKYFFDFEFVPSSLVPLSIGIVSSDGREYYAETLQVNGYHGLWIAQNVQPYLGKITPKPIITIGQEVVEFTNQVDEKHEFWAWYGAYDWVLMTRLTGNSTFENTPKNWPKYHMDLKQLSKHLGIDNLPPKIEPEHHALSDARWNKLVWEYLVG